ncbi:Phosphate transporter family protein [Babesia bovis T2Bo]|uniref:Phosphate transporter n=1 Tax=Babesia bovis TaxID=5865 RepID=A7AU97_BABBO|nr:Phosphate transporter family protein [Babesia bovis T2Bo]EDO06508.1 Phosphate transporter family protein [Babesia bovis T2Bo]|eukprot:XP_001610076.1 phosphate transporter [Babesia bovis T2Bo]
MAIAHPELLWIVVTSGLVAVFLAMAIGANDVANALSTSIGSGSLKLRTALIVAFVFEIFGALLLGGSVSDAIRKKVLNFDAFNDAPRDLAVGMMTSSLSATIWLMFATWFGIPVSTTHSIIGALAGFGVASGRVDSVRWIKMFYILLSWIIVPIIAVVVSCTLYILLQEAMLKRKHSCTILMYTQPFLIACTTLPLVILLAFENPLMKVNTTEGAIYNYVQWFNASAGNKAIVIFSMSLLLVLILTPSSYIPGVNRIKNGWSFLSTQQIATKDIDNNCMSKIKCFFARERSQSMQLNIGRSQLEVIDMSNVSSSKVTHERLLQSAMDMEDTARVIEQVKDTENHKTEVLFSAMQIIGAITVIISHSANDTANAVAPFATVLLLYLYGVEESKAFTPWYILLLGGLCMSFGLAFFGYQVIKNVGMKLTRVTPSRGYTIDTTAGNIVLIVSYLGIPLSSTHASVSSILGVGLVENLKTQNFNEVQVLELEGPKPTRWTKFPILNRISTKYVNFKLYSKIFVTWITTIFASGIMSATLYVVVIFCCKIFS